jgi:hypothetical protein
VSIGPAASPASRLMKSLGPPSSAMAETIVTPAFAASRVKSSNTALMYCCSPVVST